MVLTHLREQRQHAMLKDLADWIFNWGITPNEIEEIAQQVAEFLKAIDRNSLSQDIEGGNARGIYDVLLKQVSH